MGTEQNTKANHALLVSKSAILALLLWGTTSTFAFWPPLRDVQAGKTISASTTTIWYKVYDPVLNEWKEGSKSYDDYNIQLINADGVVAWLASSGDDYEIGYAVYDPFKRTWEEGGGYYPTELGFSHNVSQLRNDDGVVCWLVREIYTNKDLPETNYKIWEVVYVSYGAEKGAWVKDAHVHGEINDEFISESYSDFQLKTKDGVVAWTARWTYDFGLGQLNVNYVVNYALYDPSSKNWRRDSKSYSNNISSLSILNGTVHYSIGGTNYVRGYDTSMGSWHDGITKPLAYFEALPVLGVIPLDVWFTDMSIGALTWEWDFGDGGHNSERSIYHTFESSGEFTVTQTIIGPEGSDSRSIAITTSMSSSERIIYVDADANGANDGSSWTDAYNYLQDALVDANAELRPIVNVEIRVAQGLYKPDQGGGKTSGDKTATFQLVDSVAIRGGYAGFGATDPNTRDMNIYETILSGDLAANDINVRDPLQLLDETTRRENSYHVVTGNGTSEMAVLDGFTITAGNANAYSGSRTDGGGMYNEEGNPTVMNCTFTGNSARVWGGGMLNEGDLNLTNCIFRGNSARWGGGILSWNDLNLTHCVFMGNTAINSGAGLYIADDSAPSLIDCMFKRNAAKWGGGIFVDKRSRPVLIVCSFSGNFADQGGAMYNYSNCFPSLSSCIFVGNLATVEAGVMYNGPYCTPTVVNCIAWHNKPIKPAFFASSIVTYSDIQGGWLGKGNIDADPLFSNPGYWDPNGTPEDTTDDFWVDGDYHLKSQAGRWDPINQTWVLDDVTSPCIDAGDPKSPVGDEPQPNGGRINMGAYGGTGEASKSP